MYFFSCEISKENKNKTNMNEDLLIIALMLSNYLA